MPSFTSVEFCWIKSIWTKNGKVASLSVNASLLQIIIPAKNNQNNNHLLTIYYMLASYIYINPHTYLLLWLILPLCCQKKPTNKQNLKLRVFCNLAKLLLWHYHTHVLNSDFLRPRRVLFCTALACTLSNNNLEFLVSRMVTTENRNNK